MIIAAILTSICVGVACLRMGKPPTIVIASMSIHVQAFARWVAAEAAPAVQRAWGRYGESVDAVRRQL